MIVLDTHILIWVALEPNRLSTAAAKAIDESHERGGVCISAISIWELTLLIKKGRVQVSGSLEAFTYDSISRVVVKPITPGICVAAVSLPDTIPKDPADRLIAATSIVEALPLVTADEKLRRSPLLQTIW